MLVYATVPDLQGWAPSLTVIPDDATQLLRSASIVVARAVNESLYAEGTVVTAPKRDATCAQVLAWLTSGIRPGSGGLLNEQALKAKSIGTRKIEYDTNRTASAEVLAKRERVAEDLAPEAEAILRAAGVLWVPVPLSTGSPYLGGPPLAERPTYCYPGALVDWWRS